MTGFNETRFPALFTGHVSLFRDVIALDEDRFPAFCTGHVFPFRDMIGFEEVRFPALSYVANWITNNMFAGVVIYPAILLSSVSQQLP